MTATDRQRIDSTFVQPGMSQQARDAKLLLSLQLAKALVPLAPADRNRLLLALSAEIHDTLEALETEADS